MYKCTVWSRQACLQMVFPIFSANKIGLACLLVAAWLGFQHLSEASRQGDAILYLIFISTQQEDFFIEEQIWNESELTSSAEMILITFDFSLLSVFGISFPLSGFEFWCSLWVGRSWVSLVSFFKSFPQKGIIYFLYVVYEGIFIFAIALVLKAILLQSRTAYFFSVESNLKRAMIFSPNYLELGLDFIIAFLCKDPAKKCLYNLKFESFCHKSKCCM